MRADVCIKTFSSVNYSQSLSEMERQRLAFIALSFFFISQKIISGEEVEMKVRPGDNITLYCDRSLTTSYEIQWIRNCSHENQPSFVIDYRKLDKIEHMNFITNPVNNSYDLRITNISVSDLGLYYCAEVEKKVIENENGIISSSTLYYYGNRTTRLSLAESAPAVSDCVSCWTLLFSVCPVCVFLSSLLSSICVYCFCRPPTGSEWSAEILAVDVIKRDPTEKHECETTKTGKICVHTEVSYRLLTSQHPNAKI